MRDQKGRFEKGHEKIGGRKARSVEERYLDAFKSSVSVDDFIAIVQRAVNDAKRGDTSARKFIADYLIGTPVENVRTDFDGKITLRVVYGK